MDTFQFEGRVFEIRPQVPTEICEGCAFQDRGCGEEDIPGRPGCSDPDRIFIEVQQPAEPQQPTASYLARLIPLREKAPGVLEETTHDDRWATAWGVAIQGAPMVRLANLAAALQVIKLAEVSFQSGKQKAFADLADWVGGQR